MNATTMSHIRDQLLELAATATRLAETIDVPSLELTATERAAMQVPVPEWHSAQSARWRKAEGSGWTLEVAEAPVVQLQLIGDEWTAKPVGKWRGGHPSILTSWAGCMEAVQWWGRELGVHVPLLAEVVALPVHPGADDLIDDLARSKKRVLCPPEAWWVGGSVTPCLTIDGTLVAEAMTDGSVWHVQCHNGWWGTQPSTVGSEAEAIALIIEIGVNHGAEVPPFFEVEEGTRWRVSGEALRLDVVGVHSVAVAWPTGASTTDAWGFGNGAAPNLWAAVGVIIQRAASQGIGVPWPVEWPPEPTPDAVKRIAGHMAAAWEQLDPEDDSAPKRVGFGGEVAAICARRAKDESRLTIDTWRWMDHAPARCEDPQGCRAVMDCALRCGAFDEPAEPTPPEPEERAPELAAAIAKYKAEQLERPTWHPTPRGVELRVRGKAVATIEKEGSRWWADSDGAWSGCGKECFSDAEGAWQEISDWDEVEVPPLPESLAMVDPLAGWSCEGAGHYERADLQAFQTSGYRPGDEPWAATSSDRGLWPEPQSWPPLYGLHPSEDAAKRAAHCRAVTS